MTITVSKTSEAFGDTSYSIVANGEEIAEVHIHTSKGKVEVRFPNLARTEPHTVVLAPSYYGVESRDPEMVGPT